jgi:hypothetical protein
MVKPLVRWRGLTVRKIHRSSTPHCVCVVLQDPDADLSIIPDGVIQHLRYPVNPHGKPSLPHVTVAAEDYHGRKTITFPSKGETR